MRDEQICAMSRKVLVLSNETHCVISSRAHKNKPAPAAAGAGLLYTELFYEGVYGIYKILIPCSGNVIQEKKVLCLNIDTELRNRIIGLAAEYRTGEISVVDNINRLIIRNQQRCKRISERFLHKHANRAVVLCGVIYNAERTVALYKCEIFG